MQRTLTLAAFAALCTLALTCKKEPPVVPEPTLSLTAVDASCIEAWLKVTTTQVPATVRLLRDGQRVADRRLITPDSLVIDEGLLPKRAYTYVLQKLAADSSVLETSAGVQVTTMDTTSHNFTWRMDTLGTHSSVLHDVAIINDTLAYAVGEIFHRDSSENWTFFNLAKWNGREWTLHRVYLDGNIVHARWILAFGENDIWINRMVHWDGARWHGVAVSEPIFFGVRTNKAWGTSSRDFYVVGDGGFIAHYNGSSWRRLESGTGLDVVDVWGAVSSGQRREEIIAVASRAFATRDRAILRIDTFTGQVEALTFSGITEAIEGTWFVPERAYYVVGSGIYMRRSITNVNTWTPLHTGITTNYSFSIRGTALNNIIVVGAFGDVVHFNGLTWRILQERQTDGNYYRVAVTSRLILVSGSRGGAEVVLRGHR